MNALQATLSITSSPGAGATDGWISKPGSPLRSGRPRPPADPRSTPIAPRRLSEYSETAGFSAEVLNCRVCTTRSPRARAARSTAATRGSGSARGATSYPHCDMYPPSCAAVAEGRA